MYIISSFYINSEDYDDMDRLRNNCSFSLKLFFEGYLYLQGAIE